MQEHATEFEKLTEMVDGTLFDGDVTSFAHAFTASDAGHVQFWFEKPATSDFEVEVKFILA